MLCSCTCSCTGVVEGAAWGWEQGRDQQSTSGYAQFMWGLWALLGFCSVARNVRNLGSGTGLTLGVGSCCAVSQGDFCCPLCPSTVVWAGTSVSTHLKLGKAQSHLGTQFLKCRQTPWGWSPAPGVQIQNRASGLAGCVAGWAATGAEQDFSPLLSALSLSIELL